MLKVAGGVGTTGSLSYQGTWNASTNTPTLATGVGTKGYYYVVSVAGSTNLDGITDWQIGDWAVFNGTAWQKVDNTDAVTSVNGQTGTVVLTAANVGATPNTTYVIAGTGMTGGGQLNANVTLTLANTGVTAGSYGSASNVGTFTVDAQGRMTSASNTAIAIGVAAVSGAVPNTVNVLAGTGLSGGGALTGNVTINLANTAVTAGTYGNANTVAQVTVDAQGRLTNVTNVSISIANSAVTGLGTMSTQNANAVSITGGNIAVTNVSAANVTITSTLVANLSTSSTATFATSSLPLVPEGYLVVNINGVNKKIPYYAT